MYIKDLLQEVFLQHLRFLHIPKTAGTTFTQVLNNQFKENLKFQFTGVVEFDLSRLNSYSEDKQREIALFTGHAPIYTGLQLVDSLDTITFLREPVSRVKSFCQHVSEGKSSYLKKSFPPENFDLDKFLNTEAVFELHNLQTKMLVNEGACAINFKTPPSEAIEVALDNLFNRIDLYGLVEYFDESLMLFTQKYKWNLPIYKVKNTKNINKLLNFEPHHIERIRHINSLDIQLYQKAHKNFLNLMNDESFNRKALIKFRKTNNKQAISFNQYRQDILSMGSRLYRKFRAKL